jgi:hypothetical protein
MEDLFVKVVDPDLVILVTPHSPPFGDFPRVHFWALLAQRVAITIVDSNLPIISAIYDEVPMGQ